MFDCIYNYIEKVSSDEVLDKSLHSTYLLVPYINSSRPSTWKIIDGRKSNVQFDVKIDIEKNKMKGVNIMLNWILKLSV